MQELSFPERFSSNRCSLSSWERPWKSLLAFVHLSHGWLHPSWGSAEQCWPSMPGRLCNPSTWPCTCSQKHPWMNQGMAISLLFFFFPLPPPLKSYDCLGWKGSLSSRSTPTPCYRAGTPPSRAGSSKSHPNASLWESQRPSQIWNIYLCNWFFSKGKKAKNNNN